MYKTDDRGTAGTVRLNLLHCPRMPNREFVSGILVTSKIEELTLEGNVTARGIVTRLGTTFHKKARGTIRGICEFSDFPVAIGKHEFTVSGSSMLRNKVEKKRRDLIILRRSSK